MTAIHTDAATAADVADSSEGKEKSVIDVPLVGTVPTGNSRPSVVDEARRENASPYTRPVPGKISHALELDLTEAEAQVIYAMRRGTAAESSWQIFDEEEAWRILQDDVAMFGGQLKRDGYESHLLRIAGIACHAFIEERKAKNERFRAIMQRKSEGDQIEQETLEPPDENRLEIAAERGEQIITLLGALLAELSNQKNLTVDYLSKTARDELPALPSPYTRQYACAALAETLTGPLARNDDETVEFLGGVAQWAFQALAFILNDLLDPAIEVLMALAVCRHRERQQQETSV